MLGNALSTLLATVIKDFDSKAQEDDILWFRFIL